VFSGCLERVVAGKRLDEEAAERAFSAIMDGEVSPVRIAGFLTALKIRGETDEELRGAVRAVRGRMMALEGVPDGAIDVCGTGGDRLGTLNVSTAVAFVLAGLGVPVAKHGNRALSSRSGAVDVLAELGIASSSDSMRLGDALREDGIVFLDAAVHHPAMRHAGPVRRELGFRTLFNLVGPLCNPARVRRQMVGVFDPSWLGPIVTTLAGLGAESILAVHGETDRGGADEATLAGPTKLRFLYDGEMGEAVLRPEDGGLHRCSIDAISGGDPASNARALLSLLDGEAGAYRETVVLNAALALHVAGYGPVLERGAIHGDGLRRNMERARHAIDSGEAMVALRRARKRASDA